MTHAWSLGQEIYQIHKEMSQHGDDYFNKRCLGEAANLFTGSFISTFYHEPKDKKISRETKNKRFWELRVSPSLNSWNNGSDFKDDLYR